MDDGEGEDNSKDLLNPIEYVVDNVFYTLNNDEEEHRQLIDLLEALKNTEEMSYFRHGYIQRLLNLHWNNTTWKHYSIVFSFTVTSFILICVNASLVNFDDGADTKVNHRVAWARVGIDIANAVLIFVSSFYLQIRLFIKSPRTYFFQPQNINELVFGALFLI